MDTTPDSQTYSSPLRKLVRFFKHSRDQWKSKHWEDQTVVKRLQNRVRFLEKSREHWKNRATQLEAEVARLKAQVPAGQAPVEALQKRGRPPRSC